MRRPRYLSRQEVRTLDQRAEREFGVSSRVLMENAGSGCARYLHDLGATGPVTILAGKGNNAGDGFVMARHLELLEIPVRVVYWWPAEELTEDAAANLRILQLSGCPLEAPSRERPIEDLAEWLDASQWIVEALLGIGGRGPLREPLPDILQVVRQSRAPYRLALDWPCGVDCETGEIEPLAFHPTHTCTFVAPKTAAQLPDARQWLGNLHIVDIGAPRILLEQMAANAG